MVEYSLIVAVIALMALSTLTLLGDRTETTFTTASEAMDLGTSAAGGPVSVGSDETSDTGTDESGTNGSGNNTGGADDQTGSNGADEGSGNGSAPDEDHSQDSKPTEQLDAKEDGNGGNGGNDDAGAGTPEETAPSATPYPALTASGAEFFWWNSTANGGYGAWKASTTFKNDTNRHQYLDLLVTRIDDKGVASTITVKSFYVPANGSTSYTLWDNQYDLTKGVATGTVSVTVQVVSVTTSDKNWQPYSYQADANLATVAAPTPK